MNAIIRLNIPDYQIGEEVSIYFKDTMMIKGVVEKNEGKWIPMFDRWGDIVTTVCGYECSKCGEWNADNDKFCPNCGAKMLETQENDK